MGRDWSIFIFFIIFVVRSWQKVSSDTNESLEVEKINFDSLWIHYKTSLVLNELRTKATLNFHIYGTTHQYTETMHNVTCIIYSTLYRHVHFTYTLHTRVQSVHINMNKHNVLRHGAQRNLYRRYIRASVFILLISWGV